MFQFTNKNKRIVATVIAVILIVAMVIPLAVSMF